MFISLGDLCSFIYIYLRSPDHIYGLTGQDLLQQSCKQNLDGQVYDPISRTLLGQDSKCWL